MQNLHNNIFILDFQWQNKAFFFIYLRTHERIQDYHFTAIYYQVILFLIMNKKCKFRILCIVTVNWNKS